MTNHHRIACQPPRIENPPDFSSPPLALLLGDPGTGKSLLALHLAAQLSRGLPLPFPLLPLSVSMPECLSASPLPASSIICSNEDTTDTIRSRLLAANADLDFIAYNNHLSLQPSVPRRPLRRFLPPTSLLKYLDIQLRLLPNPKLLILDPLPSFLGLVDGSNNPNAISRALAPLLERAQRQRVAILGIHHLAKSPRSTNILHHALGSPIYSTLAHSVYLLTVDHHPIRNPLRSLTPIKSPTTNSPMLTFSITEKSPQPQERWDNSAPIITWLPTSKSPTHVSSNPTSQDSLPPLASLDIAIHFLQAALQPSPIPSKTLQTRAKRAGISSRTLRRARRHLRIIARHNGQHWLASLPPGQHMIVLPTLPSNRLRPFPIPIIFAIFKRGPTPRTPPGAIKGEQGAMEET